MLRHALLVGLALGTVVPAFAANLLLNSTFERAANQSTPDYWDLHHAAALRFPDLYSQYNLVEDPAAPVAGARVLKITNSDSAFPYVYLLSRIPESRLDAGSYVFSVYAKADRAGSVVQLAPTLDRMEHRVTKTLTTGWQRYTARFRIDDASKEGLSPLIILPDRASYWISAPQLERGDSATPYAPAAKDADLGVPTAAHQRAATAALAAIASATAAAPAAGISAVFEFNFYTDDTKARLRMRNTSSSVFKGMVVCSRSGASGIAAAVFSSAVVLEPGQTRIFDLGLESLASGDYPCEVRGADRAVSTQLTILAPSALAVRINRFRNVLQVNGSGFQIRGIMVGSAVPPEWYFSDIVRHGINTLIYYPGMDPSGALNSRDMDSMLQLAGKYGVKIIAGPPVMGQRNAAWNSALDRYRDFIARYRSSPAIIGWFAVDEPQAWTLQQSDLSDIYRSLKAADPYRLVFINWGSNDVPSVVGREPHGTLAATDLYSIDYYPFTNDDTGLEIYTLRTIRALRTGMSSGRPGHSWLQLYGYLDVIREPTGEELNYMAYVNLLYGGNYSYWQTKSNAKATWDRMGRTNEEVRGLADILMLNPDAYELKPPSLAGHYLYSVWKARGESYLIVLHVGARTEPFAIDLNSIVGARNLRAREYFGKAPLSVDGSMLRDSFDAYSTRVYQID